MSKIANLIGRLFWHMWYQGKIRCQQSMTKGSYSLSQISQNQLWWIQKWKKNYVRWRTTRNCGLKCWKIKFCMGLFFESKHRKKSRDMEYSVSFLDDTFRHRKYKVFNLNVLLKGYVNIPLIESLCASTSIKNDTIDFYYWRPCCPLALTGITNRNWLSTHNQEHRGLGV